ncbi:RdgB/HAM1 family non-canonical purine NTP pyrophosphatase [Maricaulis salignorans]|uniref:dITP/XTP pyrophosphatase n=1 Tax=Maricaulis salignorans TaxID=144026 RepID=A0A1G9R8U0_9PROT|nr:RdgB/HAM1 family non-canonical purine NTP pyrophosphatase [Maricaulis salignorans]SDM19643.1 XTP/dITP diphosphohydrolase [Maricaulis salignorans]
MNEQDTWVLASHNPGKIKELQAMLHARGVTLKGAAELALDEPEETESTFEGNAALKAKAAWQATGLTCLSDDSGLSVDALGGEPGIYSARWAGEARDFDRAMARVHEALLASAAADRTARFVCVVALCRPDGTLVHYRGEVVGEIVWPPRGEAGFGYDAIFQPHGHDRTFAEMSAVEKRALSHRGRALAALLAAEFEQ